MKLIEFTGLLNKLSREKVAERAIPLCRRVMSAAKKNGLGLRHLDEVYKQLLDNGTVNVEELDLFQIKANQEWSKKNGICVHHVGLDDDVEIQGDDLEVTTI